MSDQNKQPAEDQSLTAAQLEQVAGGKTVNPASPAINKPAKPKPWTDDNGAPAELGMS